LFYKVIYSRSDVPSKMFYTYNNTGFLYTLWTLSAGVAWVMWHDWTTCNKTTVNSCRSGNRILIWLVSCHFSTAHYQNLGLPIFVQLTFDVLSPPIYGLEHRTCKLTCELYIVWICGLLMLPPYLQPFTVLKYGNCYINIYEGYSESNLQWAVKKTSNEK
jgi:hypothetical protein